MSGGISAIKGFDYQATVILDLLFQHFDERGTDAHVRPEGVDDLDLQWLSNASVQRQYVQIKKPTENIDGKPVPTPWTVAAAIKDLFPGTIRNLGSNTHEQVWVLGDEISPDLRSVMDAGAGAPFRAADTFWRIAHALAINDIARSGNIEDAVATKLRRQRPSKGLEVSLDHGRQQLILQFGKSAEDMGIEAHLVAAYSQAIAQHGASLPDILSRIRVRSTFGSEQEVVERVYSRLAKEYSLDRQTVEKTVFRNLRGFISDISKQPRKFFSKEDFEIELRCVWPAMVPIKSPPEVGEKHVYRPDITKQIADLHNKKAVEIVGISGSGKTMLAAEVAAHAKSVDSERQVYYAEVRQEVSLRDVLAGVAFHLRRIGIVAPFGIAMKRSTPDESVVVELARDFAAIQCKILLLLDFVEGTCSPAFARHISKFIQSLPIGNLQVAAFAQESVLQQMSQLERSEHHVETLDVRGFHFSEFVSLVAYRHPNPDHSLLWNVYRKVTAGRAAGLFAKLAQSLASAASLPAMIDLAGKPPDAILPTAERQRFARISPSSRSAAEKLVCFALPFSRREAEQVFSTDSVGAAIRELIELGLLRPQAGDLLEMHETIRAGLEDGVSINLRQAAHSDLADWYAAQNTLTAEIFHLDKAGRGQEGRARARDAFLQGKHWNALVTYVVSKNLVSPSEVIGVIADVNKSIDYQFLLPSILRDLGCTDADHALFRILQEQPQRFISDYSWGTAIIEAILEVNPGRLHELVLYALGLSQGESSGYSALEALGSGARRANPVLETRTLQLFDIQPQPIKERMLTLLMLDMRRIVLTRVFRFLKDEQLKPLGRNARNSRIPLRLRLTGIDDAIEVLSAMPDVSPAEMLIARSALLGPLTNLVWSERDTLRTLCISVLESRTQENRVLANAIRVLIFLADPTTPALIEPLLARDTSLAAFAGMVPALMPAFSDHQIYEKRVLDSDLSVKERMAALSVLATLGSGLGSIYQTLKATDGYSKDSSMWDILFLMFCVQSPFAEAIPILEREISKTDGQINPICGILLTQIGRLPVPEGTSLLTLALAHRDDQIRQLAAQTFQFRRARSALPSLIARYQIEQDAVTAASLAVSIVASGSQAVSDLEHPQHNTEVIRLWQCILATRLGDARASGLIVDLACDPTQNWQIRRTAILAAGRLPYAAALEKILPAVMAERSPLEMDHSSNLVCHATLVIFLQEETATLARLFLRGRVGFITFFVEIFESHWKNLMFSEGVPSGLEAAGWLFDRLTHHGWPGNNNAAQAIVNELHSPTLHAAVVRSLRLHGLEGIIEGLLERSHNIWFSVKCIFELRRIKRPGVETAAKMKILVSRSTHAHSSYLLDVIDDFCGTGRFAQPMPRLTSAAVVSPEVRCLTYEDILGFLGSGEPDVATPSSFTIESMTRLQFQKLIDTLEPANDFRLIEFVPSFEFTQGGHVVTRERSTSSVTGEELRPNLRAAVAAANPFDLSIPWHDKMLAEPFAFTYVPKFLQFLGLQGNSHRLYDEILRHADAIAPFICNASHGRLVSNLIDVRIVPFLHRYIASGTDEFYEGLCSLAIKVTTPEIDPVLHGLFYRWTQRFNSNTDDVQVDISHHLWRGFNLLVKHPRFEQIAQWQSRLASVLRMPMAWYHKQDIARVLERDPQSYVQIESLLFKVTDFEHRHQSELDRLDDAAERLFHCLLED
jgi:F0F1-type ATP synthase membrane subunit c/vacuolar-type H+-ATPase subunit K